MATGVKNRNGITIDLLWQNPNPTSNFSTGDISLDLSNYDMVMIKSKSVASGGNYYGVSYGLIDGSDYVCMVGNAYSTSYFYKRRFTAFSSKINFGNGYRNTDSNASYCIPIAIYGIKGVPAS